MSSPTRLPRKPKQPTSTPPADPRGERLQKRLAAAGLGSRREIEGWISAGRVTIAGQTAVLGARVAPEDEVRVDGRRIELAVATQAVRVLLYHKPVGELVTRHDPGGRATVFSRLPMIKGGKWIAVGRLDINTAGLLLFTDSGALANRLMHPRFEVEREYAVRVQGALGGADLARLRKGVMLDDGPAAFTSIEVMRVERERQGTNHWYRVMLREGRNREVRRLIEAVGARVSRLMRVRYGPVRLPLDLPAGQWREIAPMDLQTLLETPS